MSRSQGYHEQGTLNAYNISGAEVQPGDRYGYKVICVIHKLKDDKGNPVFWSVYRGWTSWTDEHVASNGDIVSYEVAKGLFPVVDAVVPNYRM
jgi:hypothetical protein